jgi:hypothetical protein
LLDDFARTLPKNPRASKSLEISGKTPRNLVYIFCFRAALKRCSSSGRNLVAVQHGLNCVFEAAKLRQFHQMIKSTRQVTAWARLDGPIVKYREIGG